MEKVVLLLRNMDRNVRFLVRVVIWIMMAWYFRTARSMSVMSQLPTRLGVDRTGLPRALFLYDGA
jgi:hypothetical protein